MSRKPKAPNTSATEKPVQPAEVPPKGASVGALASEAAQAASPASALPQPANKPESGGVAISPLVGEAANPSALDDLVVESVMVVSQVEGFRRAGRAWSKTPTTVPIDEISEADIIALEAEPLLSVAYVAQGEAKTAG